MSDVAEKVSFSSKKKKKVILTRYGDNKEIIKIAHSYKTQTLCTSRKFSLPYLFYNHPIKTT